MSRCQWCGDTHAIDRLCQRAQRGMTRRSFCFLFGVGLAAAAVPLPAWAENTPDLPRDFPANASTKIVASLSAPTTVTFQTQDKTLRRGDPITISFRGAGVLFSGTIDSVSFRDGARVIRATDALEFAARSAEHYGLALSHNFLPAF